MINELKSIINKYHQLEEAWKSSIKNSDEYLAATCLFEYPSYRLLDSDKKDVLLGFRVFVRILKRILIKKDDHIANKQTGNALVISGTVIIQDRVTEYIQRSSSASLHSYIAKDIVSLKSKNNIRFIFAILPFAIRQSLRCLFNSSRLGIALSIAEVVEIAYILHFISENRIDTVYDFVPYEVDSNFMYLMLREKGIHVVKIPSSGPLATHHRILLSDDVVFSTPYHSEEYAKFRETFRVKNILLWPPERAYQYYPRYKNQKPTTKSKTIGFYSHGEWLRKQEKHSAYGGRIGEAESTILGYLGKYVQSNPDYHLIIFPHPREMRPDIAEKMQSFYKKAIGHSTFQIASFQGGTTQNFEQVETALAAFSTILYERLYCGYKTLIGNMAISEFPMNKSILNKICFKTYAEMEQMITEYSLHEEDYFFKKSGLEEYRAEHFPEP